MNNNGYIKLGRSVTRVPVKHIINNRPGLVKKKAKVVPHTGDNTLTDAWGDAIRALADAGVVNEDGMWIAGGDKAK